MMLVITWLVETAVYRLKVQDWLPDDEDTESPAEHRKVAAIM
jgi:hypothetical protein